MATGGQTALTYLKLSELYDRKGQPQQRDRFLVLAADAAQAAGRDEDAEKLRLRLLKHNPHHLLRPYSSFAQAMDSADVQSYVHDLRNSYPPQKAAEMLAGSGQSAGNSAAQTKPLPPTQPVVDLDAPSANPVPQEPLKVYRAKEDAAPVPKTSAHGLGERPHTGIPPEPAKKSAPSPANAKPAAAARPAAPARPAAASPAVYSLAPEPSVQHAVWREARQAENHPEGAGGAWLQTSLFVLVLAAGTAMAFYALAGPILLGKL